MAIRRRAGSAPPLSRLLRVRPFGRVCAAGGSSARPAVALCARLLAAFFFEPRWRAAALSCDAQTRVGFLL